MPADDPETIGPYRLVEEIGSGGMAKLYLATKDGIAGFRHAVAIKVVGELLADDPAFVEMFLDEARLAARIRHPNVIYTEDLGEDGGRHYIVMEYVHGGSVAELVASLRELGRRMSPALAVSVIAAAAEGLHAAHEARSSDGTPLGIVHRDVSPQNILVSSEGAVKLIDFGVARADQRQHRTLEPGASRKGKLRYMPPEQLAADPALDRRADVFSLAVVLWEMVSGRRIFGQQTSDQVSEALREGRLPRLDALTEGVPPALADAVARALSHDPAERPATAREFREAIVQAVPEAREVDAVERAAVVRALLADELEARAERLSGVGATGPNTRDFDAPFEALERWTLPLEDEPAKRPPVAPVSNAPATAATDETAPAGEAPPSEAPPASEGTSRSDGGGAAREAAAEGFEDDDGPMPFKRHALLLLALVLVTFLGLGALMWSRSSAKRRAEPTLGPSPLAPPALPGRAHRSEP